MDKKVEMPATHPAAEAYRMMQTDELEELAASIAANGLRDPITVGIVGDDRWIVDGRNRLKACEIAAVPPEFEEIEFHNEADLRAFIADRSERRNITKGQKAMGHAKLFPEPNKPGRGKKKVEVTSTIFSDKLLQQARAVLAFSPELARRVTEGTITLGDAYQKVRSEEGEDKADDRRLRELARERPDLADRVRSEELTLDAACDRMVNDAAVLKKQRWAATVNLIQAVEITDRSPQFIEDSVRLFDRSVEVEKGGEKITAERLRRSAAYLVALADLWED